MSAGLQGWLEDQVRTGAASAAAALVATPDRVLWRGATGRETRRPRVAARPSTRFDLASLTKPFVATLALVLDCRGLLPLQLPIGEVYRQAHRRLARQPLENLLRHRSSLAPWTPLAARCRQRREVEALLTSGALLEGRPRGCVYSDLGFILWGDCAEKMLGKRMIDLLRSLVFAPLGIRRASESPGRTAGVAESRLDNAREVELAAAQGFAIPAAGPPRRGVVQDGNARFLGGIAGHAGLFGPLGDVLALAREWLRPELLTRRAISRALAGSGEYALGWARRRTEGSAGPALSRYAFGHTGFTGTSVWIDPESDRILVLLAHRTAAEDDFNARRREFHRLALSLFPPT